jgi:glycosyltransferase involved in cell wall biosynthesis
MPKHSLTILIPTHGRPTLLKRTLESLKACTLPNTYHELVVIENGSRDGAQKLVADLPERLNARYMHRERGNKSYALNEALETIEDGLVVFFDDDVRVHPDTLVAYANAAMDYNGGVFFGGPVEVDFEKKPQDWLVPYLPYSAKGYDLIESRMGEEYLGFNWAAFTSDVKRLGGFDLRFGPGSVTGATGQESNMQKRMLRTGMNGVDVQRARVWHHVPKQRSNQKWVLSRHFREGVHNGMNNLSFQQALEDIFRLIKYLIRLSIYKCTKNKIEIYKSRLAIQLCLGRLKGVCANLFMS